MKESGPPVSAVSVKRIAHYRIQKRIGRGGMGVVYRALDERDQRIVALKVIRETEAQTEESAPHIDEARVRFQREADILQGLLHVNIVSFYEIGEEDGTPYLAMEYLEGLPITSYAGRAYPETVPLLIQAAHGLEYLGTRGIVHRDLSPDNIYVTDGGGGEKIVKLLDFGVAKLFESKSGHESLTATGFFLGKVAYGSPEQLGSLGHGAPLDFRSDVYSLGVIFYQVLAGRRPFDGKAPVEYIAAHLNLEAPPVAAPPDAPPLPMDLVRLVSSMLKKRREERPSYREIIDRLVAVLRDPSRGPSTGSRPGLAGDVPPSSAGSSGDLRDTAATSLVGRDASITNEETLPSSRKSAKVRLARAAAGLIFLAAVVGLLVLRMFTRVPHAERVPVKRPPPVLAARTTPAPTATAPTGPTPAASAAFVAGGLRILATPYARVLAITEVVTGKPVALEAGATTPLLLSPLAPGRYSVTLFCPALGARARPVSREVEVTPGAPVLLNEPFLSAKELVEMMK